MNRCVRCSGELSALAVFCPHCWQAQEPDFGQLLGQTIDDYYRIYRRLGGGGLSTVFAATDLHSDRVAAIKVSDPVQLVRRERSFALDGADARRYWVEMLERMRREAESLTGVSHPNLVRFYGTGLISEDLRYVAMEFLRGHTLREELDQTAQSRGLELREALKIALDVCAALTEIHARGIVHRDINPNNIFLCDTDGCAVKLIDFGIARFPQPDGAPPFTRHGAMNGTVAYASPEQCQSQPLDHRSDIYSLGVVLYEMLTGERPFTGRTPTEIALKQIQAEPPSPRMINASIPSSLDETIRRALAKNPADRHLLASELAAELQARSNPIVIDLPQAQAVEDVEIESSQPKPVRQWRRAALASAVLITTLVAAGLIWDFVSSSGDAPLLQNDALAAASPSPSIIPGTPGSDADEMELAANLPGRSSASVTTANPQPAATAPQSNQPGPAAPVVSPADRVSQSPAPVSTTPTSQKPPAPTPTVIPTPAPQVAPVERQPAPVESSRENESHQAADPNARSVEPGPSPPRREPRDVVTRPRRNEPQKEEGDDEAENKEEDPIGPKLIQWNGYVRGEREITIELPGIPGTIEIPRVYRDRVGVIEPPTARNRWECVTVRVFGRGHISFVMRWWPIAGNGGRISARN